MKKIGIAGLGLIGGSLAKAIKREKLRYHIVASDANVNALTSALFDGVIDEYGTTPEVFHKCDLVFICVPVLMACDYLKQLSQYVSDSTIITDTGSTKNDIEQVAKALGLEQQFVGGHPMAGSEKSGYEAAVPNLFENAYYVLSENNDNTKSVSCVREIVQDIGALPMVMAAKTHDEVVSMISHVPHLVASSLVNAVDDINSPAMKILAAGGFKDITRIASGSPIMWRDICVSNATNIVVGLDRVIQQLQRFKQTVQQSNGTEMLLQKAKTYRDTLQDNRQSEIVPIYRITVDVDDRPGIIAEVASRLAEQSINISNIGINNSREMEEGVLEICFYERESRNRSFDYLNHLGYKAYKK